MFEHLRATPPDPILSLMGLYRDDPRAEKVDLGVGVYKDEAGNTPVMNAVTAAEEKMLKEQTTKTYIGMAGSALFNTRIAELLLGESHKLISEKRLTVAQTPGGCGALRMVAEFLASCTPDSTIWVSDPTWGNHIPLLSSAGFELQTYRYFNPETHGVDFEAMLTSLEAAKKGDIVLLHGCCHNPSGADLSRQQWEQITDLVISKGLLPFIDIAYQGLGDGLDDDAYGVRYMAERVSEMVIAGSCSKNFGLYRERVGYLMIVSATAEQTANTTSQMMTTIRQHYSMPPSHGAAIVETILSDATLKQQWLTELDAMNARIHELRGALASRLAELGAGDFSFITRQKGMFSFLGINKEQIHRLREEFGIYMIDSSRVNIAGMSSKNIDYVARSIAAVLK
ncbi:aromatic amino acid transaminase [Pokkaliibacter sp. CJK22405]|uniref:amino acid aminotransferase n=1 Tax=Pokkaliibacter sp. CJK22405 TaxID=3384615 RepID=UPI003984C67D